MHAIAFPGICRGHGSLTYYLHFKICQFDATWLYAEDSDHAHQDTKLCMTVDRSSCQRICQQILTFGDPILVPTNVGRWSLPEPSGRSRVDLPMDFQPSKTTTCDLKRIPLGPNTAWFSHSKGLSSLALGYLRTVSSYSTVPTLFLLAALTLAHSCSSRSHCLLCSCSRCSVYPGCLTRHLVFKFPRLQTTSHSLYWIRKDSSQNVVRSQGKVCPGHWCR